ncbi:MAG: hypothetical protein HYX94_09400 [Chloroflexi bacterium]|nr:hypothetical protein [Chloroflexota bacterium]
MTRVDELQKKYPSIARQILVKAEALTCGIRDSGLLYSHGFWSRTGGVGTYQNLDHDTSLKEVAGKRPTAAAKAGYVKRLDSFYMQGGWGFMVQRDSASPYEIKEPESGKYALFEGEEKVQDVYLPQDVKPWPYREREEPLTSTGKPITSVVSLTSPTCARIAPVRHCEYFATGEQCKFCNYNVTHEDARSVGAITQIANRVEEVAEAYKILTSETIIVETGIVGGAFTKVDKEVKMYTDLCEKIVGAASYDPNIHIVGQPPKSRRDLQRLKDSGLQSCGFDLEVWDPRLFAEICPGKAKHIGYERYREAMLEGVDVFGAGHVSCALVSGATLAHPSGHKTWQESRDVLIEAVRWLTKNGVVPHPIQQRWAPGSEFSKDPTNRDRMPPVDHHLDIMLAQHAAMKEHGLYEKMDRFAGACTLCCEDVMFWCDLGIFEATGGNVSKWLADLVPDDVNWLARIAASIEE